MAFKLKASTQQSYIPRNPSEEQSPLNSTLQVLRTSDGASFLATAFPKTVIKNAKATTFTTPLIDAILPTAAQSLSLLLNHPNIISLIDIQRNTAVPGDISTPNPWADISIWEDMDAGNLAYLLPLSNTYPDAGDARSWAVLTADNTHRFALPEGLVWHVLRSISRALLWLHSGIKEVLELPGTYTVGDPDWHPVLIMDVSPSQIWFQHPRGRETYGSCKLGGFSKARVTGAPGGSVALVPVDSKTPVGKQWFWAPELRNSVFSSSRASEIWSLGATLYAMMTGVPPISGNSYEWNMSRMNDGGYSQGLRDLVGVLLREHPADRLDVQSLVNRADDACEGWRTTEQGAMYVDVRDVLRARNARGGRVAGAPGAPGGLAP